MRLHKSEAAFFIFIAVILAAGVMIFHAYDVLFSIANGLIEPERYEDIAYLSKLFFATGFCSPRGCSSACSSSFRSSASRSRKRTSFAP